MSRIRTGIGFDVHAFALNRKLIIGGIEIPFEKGLAGHSDADVLLHAICDALLGALSLGDIGKYFPDNELKFKNADSSLLLEEVYRMIENKGYTLCNVDSVVMIQNPKIFPYINEMRKKIAAVLNTETDNISIKATTTEQLGFTGREEGAAAMATVLLMKVNE